MTALRRILLAVVAAWILVGSILPIALLLFAGGGW